jgi:DNA-binding ferritin-like protein
VSQTTTPNERDESTTEYYERRQHYVDELAERDDELGALARAIQAVATSGDTDA